MVQIPLEASAGFTFHRPKLAKRPLFCGRIMYTNLTVFQYEQNFYCNLGFFSILQIKSPGSSGACVFLIVAFAA